VAGMKVVEGATHSNHAESAGFQHHAHRKILFDPMSPVTD